MRRRKVTTTTTPPEVSPPDPPPDPYVQGLHERYDYENTVHVVGFCSVCEAPQFVTPGGVSCRNGHGGAEPKEGTGVPTTIAEEKRKALMGTAATVGFSPRPGDTLEVRFEGASIQIAPYTMVQIDAAIYRRCLEPGDDPEAEYDRIYEFVRRKCMERARMKLREFADEYRRAQARAAGRDYE